MSFNPLLKNRIDDDERRHPLKLRFSISQNWEHLFFLASGRYPRAFPGNRDLSSSIRFNKSILYLRFSSCSKWTDNLPDIVKNKKPPISRFGDISSPQPSTLILPIQLESMDRPNSKRSWSLSVFASIPSTQIARGSFFDRILINRFFDPTF
jgi:hypothetical protein